ncbi:MAG: hypothetical protein R3350_10310 [Saprospiraceae bacterium]|nr:hypothetical protein [Saprospiraceae bacterium]
MNYRKSTVWIFVLLMLQIFFMILFPRPIVLGIGSVLLPLLVLLQVVIVLRAEDESPSKFEDRWYDHE